MNVQMISILNYIPVCAVISGAIILVWLQTILIVILNVNKFFYVRVRVTCFNEPDCVEKC